MNYPKLKLKSGRDWSVRRGHAWLFSGGLQNIPKNLEPGAIVDLYTAEDEFLARGYYNPKTDIAVRVLTYHPNEAIDQTFFERKIATAQALRHNNLNLAETNAFRLVNAEGDQLPGLIIDYYAGYVVVQSHTAGIDRQMDVITQALGKVFEPKGILLRNDVAVRNREGLSKENPRLLGGEVPEEVVIKENNLQFALDLWKGQKTGFYTDQRDKRHALQVYAKSAVNLLNCFSYTGGFSVYAAKANPELSVTSVDQSAPALEIAKRNFSLNDLSPDNHRFLAVDAFDFLHEQKQHNKTYDVVILDPPAFAKSIREKDKALQGYLRLNRLGLPLVKDGGILITCSCSGSVSADAFEESVIQASMQTGTRLQLLEVMQHGTDHPLNLAMPENRYLKVLFCRVFRH
jgi:23S rRNA (cytosine1962-C5)-methyltransferase